VNLAEDLKNSTSSYSVSDSRVWTPTSADIYFLETSGSSNLNLRQLCAVESAARSHPDSVVLAALLSTANELNMTQATRNILDVYKNINIVKVDLKTWLHGTPVSPETVQGRQLFESVNNSTFKVLLLKFK
jgi:hypothetical protein